VLTLQLFAVVGLVFGVSPTASTTLDGRVADLLRRLDLQQYAGILDANAVDFAVLRELADQDYKEMGIKALGHRKKLIKAARPVLSLSSNKNRAAAKAEKPVCTVCGGGAGDRPVAWSLSISMGEEQYRSMYVFEDQSIEEAAADFCRINRVPGVEQVVPQLVKTARGRIPKLEFYENWLQNNTAASQPFFSGAGRPKKVRFHQSSPETRVVVRHVLRQYGYEETAGDDWDVLWSLHSMYDIDNDIARLPTWEPLQSFKKRNFMVDGDKFLPVDGWASVNPTDESRPWQVHNHCLLSGFPGLIAGNKANLHVQMTLMQQQYEGGLYDFYPQSFLLPEQWADFERAYASTETGSRGGGDGELWVAKATLFDRGRAVEVFRNVKEASSLKNLLDARRESGSGITHRGDKSERQSQAEQIIVQRYVSPALIAGRKYHLRLYVAIVQHDPLVISMSLDKEGLVLMAAKPYGDQGANGAANGDTDKYRHVTNGEARNALLGQEGGRQEYYVPQMGWGLESLWSYLQAEGHDVEALKRKLAKLAVKTVMTLQSANEEIFYKFGKLRRSGSCFDLFGFDVMLDQNYEPRLLEVNFGPQLDYLEIEAEHQKRAVGMLHELTKCFVLRGSGNAVFSTGFQRLFDEFRTTYSLNHCSDGSSGSQSSLDLNCLTAADVEYLHHIYTMYSTDCGFNVVFPAKDTMHFQQLLKLKTHRNKVAWQFVALMWRST
jgi:hypothetical protein